MATAAQVKTSLKARLGIALADTQFDAILDEAIPAAVFRLYPRTAKEIDYQSPPSISVDTYGECFITLTALTVPVTIARRVEAYDGFTWRTISDTLHHGTKLRLRGLSTSDTSVRIYGKIAYAIIDDVPTHVLQAIYWYGMAEFYDYMAGAKADYNIYMQTPGARAVDNARDESTYYDTKANNYLDEQVRT